MNMFRRAIAFTLAAVMAIGLTPALLAQQGTISGRANDEARRPYADYSVQLMDLQTNQIAATVPLDGQGQFAFTGVAPDKRYLVQLFHLRDNRVVCTEGPYIVAGPDMLTRTDVNIDCGKPPALWLLAAAAGVAAGVAFATQSNSQ